MILKDKDLNNISSRIERFHKEMEDLRNNKKQDPWLRISAAIGHAVYDPAVDKDANRVFERADRSMYEDKERLKSIL